MRLSPASDPSAELDELLRLKSELESLKAEIKLRRLLRTTKAFNLNQRRVPPGNPDGGEWTSGGGGTRTRLAAADKPRLGPAAGAAIAAEIAKRLIEAYRSENFLKDLFGRRIGTVSTTKINGEDIFGSNSTSPTYKNADFAAAERMRDNLIKKYPDVFNADDLGRMPNNALFHAETTVLLRAARANGGSLAGQTLEVVSDNIMCNNCEAILPHVGLELGNPRVTFIGPKGERNTMRDGVWIN